MTDPFTFKYDKYSLNQKEKLVKLCLKYKLEADSSKEKHWDPKIMKFVANQQSFKSRAVREFFPTLKKAKSDSTEFKRALAIANRCFEKYTSTKAEQELEDTSKKKYREPGTDLSSTNYIQYSTCS